MKKLIAAVAAFAFAGPVVAEELDSITLPIGGNLPQTCDIDLDGEGNLQGLTMAGAKGQYQGNTNVDIICNFFGEAMINFSSQNGGKLVNADNSDFYVEYVIRLANSDFVGKSLVNPQSFTESVVAEFTDTNTGGRAMSVALEDDAQLAGDYNDVITITASVN